MMNQNVTPIETMDYMAHYITCDNKEFMTMIPVPATLVRQEILEDIEFFIVGTLSGTECGIKYLIEYELAWYEIPPCTEVDEIPEDYFEVFEEEDDELLSDIDELPFD